MAPLVVGVAPPLVVDEPLPAAVTASLATGPPWSALGSPRGPHPSDASTALNPRSAAPAALL
jgi:hypothetical protein